MISTVLKFYLQGLLISAVVVLILSIIYAFAYLVRNTDKSKTARRNRILDLILVDILTIPILSFAVVGLLVILRTRG